MRLGFTATSTLAIDSVVVSSLRGVTVDAVSVVRGVAHRSIGICTVEGRDRGCIDFVLDGRGGRVLSGAWSSV